MALVRRMVSDISGTEAADSEFITLIVRHHPATREAKALDVLPPEIAQFNETSDLVTLEVGNGAEKRTILVPLADFRRLVSDDVVRKARPTRGRRPGFSTRG